MKIAFILAGKAFEHPGSVQKRTPHFPSKSCTALPRRPIAAMNL